MDPVSREVPDWFCDNIEAPRTEHQVSVDGTQISYLKWDDQGSDDASCIAGKSSEHTISPATEPKKPGLLLLHGNYAHAHWWTHIASFWAQDYVVVAPSLSGHGQSGWRSEYSFAKWAEEMAAVARHAGFRESQGNILVAHSMGVCVATVLERQCNGVPGKNLFDGIILIDEIPRPKEFFKGMPQVAPREPTTRWRPISRLPKDTIKLRPPQQARLPFILDFIASKSTREKINKDSGTPVWSWSFDPAREQHTLPQDRFPKSVERFLSQDMISNMKCRTAIIVGENSLSLPADLVRYNRIKLGWKIPFVTIRDSGHHIMIDRPLALVAAVDSIIEGFRQQVTLSDGTVLPRIQAQAPSPKVLQKLSWKLNEEFAFFRQKLATFSKRKERAEADNNLQSKL